MSFNRETKAFGSIRRYKGYGACGVILGLAALSIAMNTGVVSADEVKANEPKSEVSGEVKESAIKNETPTGNAATSSIQAVPTRPEEHKAEIAKEGSVTGEASVTVDHKEVTKAADAAKEVGVKVVKDETKVAPTTATAEETAKAVKSISAEEKQQTSTINSTATAHSTAVSNWVEEKNSTVAYNKDLVKAHEQATESYKEFVNTLDGNVAKVVAQYKDAIIATTSEIQRVDPSSVESYQNYIKALASRQALNSEAITTYLKEKAVVEDFKKQNSLILNDNKSLSDKNKADNLAKSQSVVKENERRSLSASAETKRIADSVAAVNKPKQDAYNKQKDAYNTALEKYKKEKSDYDKKLKEITSKPLVSTAKGVKLYGSFDESKRGSLDYYGKLTAVFDSNIKDLEVVDGGLGATKSTRITINNGMKVDPNFTKGLYGKFTTIDGSVLTNITKGSAFTLHNLGKTKTGKTISAKLTATSDAIPEHKIAGNKDTYSRLKVWWYINGSTGSLSPVGMNPYNYINPDFDIQYFDEATGKPLNLGLTSIYSDLDYNQAVRHTYGDKTTGIVVNPKGSLVQETTVRGQKFWKGIKTDGVYENDDPSGLNRYKKGDKIFVDVDDFRDTPEGSILSVGYGSNQHLSYLVNADWSLVPYSESASKAYKVYWNNDNASKGKPADSDFEIYKSGYAFQLWGGKSVVDVVIPPKEPTPPTQPKLEKVPAKPVSYTPVEYKPDPFKPKDTVIVPREPELRVTKLGEPVAPKPKEVPNKPEVPEVRYHLTELNENTPVEKEVRNEENVSINGESVAKNSTNYFVLKPSALPANRPVTKSIGFSDYIAGGLDLDIKGMQKVNPNYTVALEKSTRLLTVSAKDSEIAKSNENLKVAYNVTPFTVIFKPVNDAATYENVFKFDINGGAKGEDPNGYTSYSNKVRIHTPGSPENPNNPNNPNGGGNHKIQPTKNNTNKEGKNINGKELLQSDVNYYVAEWDLDQYIKDKSSKSAIAKGFAYLENYPEEAVTPLVKEYYAVTSKGEKLGKGEFDFYEADSTKLAELPEKVQTLIKDSGIDVSKFGKFQVWVAKDPQAFYDKYVKTGQDIFFHMPMSVNVGFTGKYENQTYQIDFGNGYYGNVVKNNVPNLTPKKDVVVDSASVDNQTINYGQEFDYLLKGAKLPSNRGSHLWEVRFLDDYDEKGDKYLGYQTIASTNITVTTLEEVKSDTKATEEVTLEDGTVVKVGDVIRKGSKVRRTHTYKVGDDLTKFTESVLDEKNGVITVSFKEDFLKTVEDSSEFGADVKLHMKRIAYGEFENTYVNRINGVDYVSNTVKTNTPEPPKPEEPKKPQLPNTGETETAAASIAGYGLLALAGLSLLGTAKRKDSEE